MEMETEAGNRMSIAQKQYGVETAYRSSAKMATVMLDLDGVLADFSHSFTRLARGLGLHHETAWGAAGQPAWGYHFHVDPVWEAIATTPNWWMSIPSLMSAEDVKLINDWIMADRVMFASARHDIPASVEGGFSVETQTRFWLRSMGINSGIQKIALVGDAGKAEACKQYGVTHALDDHPMYLAELTHHAGIRAVARDWPYNRDEWKGDRVGSVTDFLRLVEREIDGEQFS